MSLIASTSTAHSSTPNTTGGINTTGAKLIVVTIESYPAAAALTDSEGNTWVAATPVSQSSLFLKQWYCIDPVTDAAHTFQAVGGGSSVAQIAVQAFNDIVTFLDEAQNADPGAVTSIQPGSIDPTPDDALFVCGVWLEGADVPTINSSFTLDETNTGGTQTIGAAHKFSDTAENPTWSSFTSGATFGALSSMLVFTVPPSDPPVITTTTLPSGIHGAAYSQTLAKTGGTDPTTWSVISGALPDGLSLNPTTGAITGTPTVIDTFNFTVQAEDDLALTDTQALTIEIVTAFGDFDFLQITPGLRLENVGWVGAVLRVSFGRGLGAQASVDGDEGLHKWFLHSGGIWPDDLSQLTINGVSRFEYYWEFFKAHTTGATDIFIMEWRDQFYHASFAEPEMTVEKFKNALIYEGGLSVIQRRINGALYNADGSIAGELPLAGPESVAGTALSDVSIELTWVASPDVVDGYEYRLDGGTPVDVGNVLAAIADGLTPATEYTIEVRAYQGPTFSPWVSGASVTTSAIPSFSGGTGLLFRDDFTDLSSWTGDAGFTAVANPTLVAFDPSQRTYEPTGASAGSVREPSIAFDDDTYYIIHDGPADYDSDTPWYIFLSVSTDGGFTWTPPDPTWFLLQKTENPVDGYWLGRSVGLIEKRDGVWYLQLCHSPSTFAGLPGEPYETDVWSTASDPTADDWDFGGQTAGEDVHSYDDFYSYVSGMIEVGGTLYVFLGCRNVGGERRIILATAPDPNGPITKVGTVIDDAIILAPENPKPLNLIPQLGMYGILANQVGADRTYKNSLYLSSSITDWSDATRHDFQQAQPVGSTLDAYRAIGFSSPVQGADGELFASPLGNISIIFDGDPPASPDGNHYGRRLKFAGLEVSTHRMEIDAFGTAGVFIERTATVAHDDFVATFVVEATEVEANAHLRFTFRDVYTIAIYVGARCRLYKGATLLVDFNGANFFNWYEEPAYNHHRGKLIMNGNNIKFWFNGELQIDYTDDDSPSLSGTEIVIGADRVKGSVRKMQVEDGTYFTITGFTPGDVVASYGPGPHTPQSKQTVGGSGTIEVTASAYPVERLVVNGVSYDVEIYGGEVHAKSFYGI